jgi:hypothetical protein
MTISLGDLSHPSELFADTIRINYTQENETNEINIKA